VQTRDATISRVVPDILAVLPNARPQRAARDVPGGAVAIALQKRTRPQGTCGNRGHSQDLAAPA